MNILKSKCLLTMEGITIFAEDDNNKRMIVRNYKQLSKSVCHMI
jgi:hypothetical protein